MAIDEIQVGDTPWHSFIVWYKDGLGGADDREPQPKWMSDIHEVFYCNPWLIVH
jgi:hypothetical protein